MHFILRILIVAIVAALAMPDADARGGRGGGGRGGGGGGRGGGGRASSGSFSRGGGGRSSSRPSGSRSNVSRPSGSSRNYNRSTSRGTSNFNRGQGGMVPSRNTGARTRTSSQRLSNSASQLPSSQRGNRAGTNRPSRNVGQRPSTQPVRPGNRPGAGTGQGLANRPSNRDVGNFLNLDTNAGGGRLSGTNLANRQRPSQLPANQRQQLSQRFANREQRPALGENRTNWNEWSQNRSNRWDQAVNTRQDFWNNWSNQRQDRLNNFQENRDQRWGNLQSARDDRQAWRNQNREDWQNYRKDMWDYRYDRADQIWDNVKDYHDDLFDDHWWGNWYPGYGWATSNPWWWWAPATVGFVTGFVSGAATSEPYYSDYGVTTVYQGDTVYVDGQPAGSTKEYTEKAVALANKVESAPPPTPAKKEGSDEWLPLGVWALTQEEKGDAVMFFQISVSKDGVISGAYKNTLIGTTEQIVGSVDTKTQVAAWRIGQNGETVIETGLFNLTRDVTSVAVHFKDNTQTWLMVRLPQPAMPDQPTKVEAIDRTLPPLTPKKES
jgi:hypothetical protein